MTAGRVNRVQAARASGPAAGWPFTYQRILAVATAPTPATTHQPAPGPTAGSSGPPRPGQGPESGRPADGLRLFTLAAPNPAGSHDFGALAGALWYGLATSSQMGSHSCGPTHSWGRASLHEPRSATAGAFLRNGQCSRGSGRAGIARAGSRASEQRSRARSVAGLVGVISAL